MQPIVLDSRHYSEKSFTFISNASIYLFPMVFTFIEIQFPIIIRFIIECSQTREPHNAEIFSQKAFWILEMPFHTTLISMGIPAKKITSDYNHNVNNDKLLTLSHTNSHSKMHNRNTFYFYKSISINFTNFSLFLIMFVFLQNFPTKLYVRV